MCQDDTFPISINITPREILRLYSNKYADLDTLSLILMIICCIAGIIVTLASCKNLHSTGLSILRVSGDI